jgi:hypothetical protein
MSGLLTTVQPAIDRAVVLHAGGANPTLRARAKRMAISAIQSYDPQRASLGTHLE